MLIAVSSLPPPSNIFLPLVTGIIFGLYILFDTILTTRRIGDSYRPKPYNRGYGYLSAIFLSSVLIQPSLKAFGLQAFKIPSAGMSPTLKIGDHILVRKYSYGIRNPFTAKCIGWCKWPDRGDSIVFIFPEDRSKDFIQRVIAVAGDSVEIRTKKVLINGKAINDPHASFEESQTSSLAPANQDDYSPETIPANHLFVLGDNRNRSYDSRFWGFINLDDVRGKAFVIYWSGIATIQAFVGTGSVNGFNKLFLRIHHSYPIAVTIGLAAACLAGPYPAIRQSTTDATSDKIATPYG